MASNFLLDDDLRKNQHLAYYTTVCIYLIKKVLFNSCYIWSQILVISMLGNFGRTFLRVLQAVAIYCIMNSLYYDYDLMPS